MPSETSSLHADLDMCLHCLKQMWFSKCFPKQFSVQCHPELQGLSSSKQSLSLPRNGGKGQEVNYGGGGEDTTTNRAG